MQTEDIVKMNEWLIRSVASKFYYPDKEELYQAGALGIMKAYQNYKKNGTTKFSTYAYDYVFGEMYQMVYKNQSIKISRDILRSYQRIEMTRSAMAQKLHKIPSNQEVASFLEMDVNLVEQIVTSGSAVMCSLDDVSSDERSYYETIAKEEKVSLDDSLTLQECIESLNPDEKNIIECRYFKDMTQSETAQKLHMTQVMVSRYEKKGLEKMKSYYGEWGV